MYFNTDWIQFLHAKIYKYCVNCSLKNVSLWCILLLYLFCYWVRKHRLPDYLTRKYQTPRTSERSVKVNSTLKSDRVNLVAPASPIECLLYLRNVRAIQYKLGPEKLTWLGNSNVLQLPVTLKHLFF